MLTQNFLIKFFLTITFVGPWVAAILASKLVTFSPLIIIFFLLIVLLLKNVKLSKNFLLLLLLTSGFTLLNLFIWTIRGTGIGSGGLLIILVCASILSISLSQLPQGEQRANLYCLNFYKLAILMIFFEIIIIILGFQPFLHEIASQSSVVNIYKDYNHAHFLHFLGVTHATGLGGIFLGSQSACIIVISAVCYFYYMLPKKEHQLFWLIFAILLYPFTATQTGNLVIATVLFFIIPKRFLILYISLLLVFGYELVLYKIAIQPEDTLEYTSTFVETIDYHFSLPLGDRFFGQGTLGWKHPQNSTDFGLMAIITQIGYIYTALLVALGFLAVILIKSRSKHIKSSFYGNFLSAHFFCSLIWLMSLVHYTNAVEFGGRELLSFHIACMLSILVMSKDRFNSYKHYET